MPKLSTGPLALLTLVDALTPVTSTTISGKNTKRQESPCAQLSTTLQDRTVPAQIALSCLRTVPLQNEANVDQLDGLRMFLESESDLLYLNSSQPARLYPDVDLLAGLDTLQQRLGEDYYSNEFDFQADIARLFASAYNGHLVYVPDIVGVFSLAHVLDDQLFSLVSVSSDGTSLPDVYAYKDLTALSQSQGSEYEPSPITEINGRGAEDFLNEHAALTGDRHDPDANYNRLFPNELSRQYLPSTSGMFEQFQLLQDPGEETVVAFDNGTEVRLQVLAATDLDVSGISDGQEFFQRCCNNSVLQMLTDPSMLPDEDRKRSLQRRLIPEMEDSTFRYLRNEEQHAQISWNAHVPKSLQARQAARSGSPFPEPVFGLEDGSMTGYFVEGTPDLAVLAIASFLPSGSPETATFEFGNAVRRFLDAASDAQKTRLVIDLRGNGGGYGFLAHETFRQLFPDQTPYDAYNYRATELFDAIGQTVSEQLSGVTTQDFGPGSAPALFSGPYPFNYRQQLDAENNTFASWSDLFGPADVPSTDDQLTNIVRSNASNIYQTAFPVYPLGRNRVAPEVFEPANIVLLQDGACASTCVLFSEFMKASAPGAIRSVVVGGRRQEGPMQYAGGVKGGQLTPMAQVGGIVLGALQNATLSQQLDFERTFGQQLITSAIAALSRAYYNPQGTTASLLASINFRNTIREGDSSVTPLQYVYDAASCKIFYTAPMYGSQELLWERVYEVAWENGNCVAGSTNHPSANRTTEYGDVEIPDNAESTFGIRLSQEQGELGTGAAPSGGDEHGEESASGKTAISVISIHIGLAIAVVASIV
ncbi:hypothetical protein CBER1_01536 [Cercospora berteroae]|uniref:Uncharacterized protein n=1 Tax=Cercospora berteroae TaxID=357750 RepID=A0A2S6C5V5_9PEZI|nr:hypothetical protein CBER1_01536 [Cercospora berteroae]